MSNLGRPSIGIYNAHQLTSLLNAWEVPEQPWPKHGSHEQLLVSLHPATGLKQASITAAGRRKWQVVVWPIQPQLINLSATTEFTYVARPTGNLNGMMGGWVADIYRGEEYVGTTLPNHRRDGVHYVAAAFVEQLLASEKLKDISNDGRFPYHLFDYVGGEWQLRGTARSKTATDNLLVIADQHGRDREFIAW